MRKSTLIKSLRETVSWGYLALVYLYLLGPMIVVIIAAFNSAQSFPSPFEGFTLHWFGELIRHDEFMKSMWISARVGLYAASIATLIGLPLSIFIVRSEFKGKAALEAFFNSPMIIPQVALSIAFLQMFSLAGLKLSDFTLIMAHAISITPYVIRACISSLHFVDPSLEESAMNLGANQWQTFFYITLPMIKAGITAGFVLSFILSFINVPLSLFISSPSTTTLPIRIFAHMESRLDPILAAVGAVTVIGVTIIGLFMEKVLKIRLLL
jgi:putative spermidine/putrescine transport system permease protein